jgi:hypothetical protein
MSERVIAQVRDLRGDEMAVIPILFVERMTAYRRYVNLNPTGGEVEHESQGGVHVVEMAGAQAERREDER